MKRAIASRIQQWSPAHPGHAQRGQLGQRRRLRQAHHVHRAADRRDEGAQRIGLPQADRVHAVGAGLEVGVRASQCLGNERLLGPGAGPGEHGAEEDVDPRVDQEWVAVLRRGLAHGPEALGLPVGIAQAAAGRCPRGCSRPPRRCAAQPPARRDPSRSRPRRRRSRAPPPRSRFARPRRASRRPAPRGPRIRAPLPRPRCRSRPRGTRPRPLFAPWARPRHSEAGAARRDGAATATGHTGSGCRLFVGAHVTSLRRVRCAACGFSRPIVIGRPLRR